MDYYDRDGKYLYWERNEFYQLEDGTLVIYTVREDGSSEESYFTTDGGQSTVAYDANGESL